MLILYPDIEALVDWLRGPLWPVSKMLFLFCRPGAVSVTFEVTQPRVRRNAFVLKITMTCRIKDALTFCSCSSYVRFDIIRRILTRVFGCNVIMVMGITDVDDKIIKRAGEVSAGGSDGDLSGVRPCDSVLMCFTSPLSCCPPVAEGVCFDRLSEKSLW